MYSRLFRKDSEKRSRGERGQAMIEVALLLPFVFVLLLLVIEFGFLMWSHLNINAAAREAVRAAAVGSLVGDTCQADTVRGRALAASLQKITCADVVEVGYRDIDGGGVFGRGDEVVVRIKHEYHALTPIVSALLSVGHGCDGLGSSLCLQACADARLERTYPDPGNPSYWEIAGPFRDCAS